MLVLSLGLGGCGGSSKPTLTIGARNTPEETILAQIYAQALRQAGYTVRANVNLGSEPADATKALARGRISGYPDHLSTPTGLSWGAGDPVPADPQKAYRQALGQLEAEDMTAFPPTPYSFTNLVGTLKPTADKRGLKTISDLEGQSEELTIAGVNGCHEAINCVEGLEKLYGLAFAGFIYNIAIPTEPFEAIETEFSDLAMLPSTDGRLSADKSQIATLEDNRHLFPAGNAIFVTTSQLADEAGSDFEATIVAAQKGLTLPVMQRLDAEVELEKRDPAAVAADYLKRAGSNG